MTITTAFRFYEFVCMPFGLANSSQTFQRFIDETLRGFKCTVAYLDDILIASEDKAQHLRDLEKVFQELTVAGMQLNSANPCLG